MLRGVYPERSEGLSMTLPVSVVKFHNQGHVLNKLALYTGYSAYSEELGETRPVRIA